MTTVYLVRHGEAEGNVFRRIHGHYNSTITENGLRQLEALSARFSNVHLDAAYSSDLYRAWRTAQAVCLPKHLPVQSDPRLREVGMGNWEDRTWAEVARTDREQAHNFSKRHLEWTVEGSEGFQRAADRFAAAVFEHAAAHDGQTIGIFAHGSVIRTFLCRAHGLPLSEINQIHHSDNTGVTLLEIEGESIRLVYENDNTHLSPEISTLARQSWWKKHQTEPEPCLWFRWAQFPKDGPVYLNARREAWSALYHTLDKLDDYGFLQDAEEAARKDPRALSIGMLDDSIAGILQLDFQSDLEDDAVLIAFYYMMPEFRHKHMGIQLLGQATSICRSLGRSRLRLRVSSSNHIALRFYGKLGFRTVGQLPGAFTALHIMEKSIEYEAGYSKA